MKQKVFRAICLTICVAIPTVSEAARWKWGPRPAGTTWEQRWGLATQSNPAGWCHKSPNETGPGQCRWKVANNQCQFFHDGGTSQCNPTTFSQQKYIDTKNANAALSLGISYLGYVPNADAPKIYETDEFLYAMQQYGVEGSTNVSVTTALELLSIKPTLNWDKSLDCRIRDKRANDAKRVKNATASLAAVYGGFWISAPSIGLASIAPQLRWGMVFLGNLSLLWGIYADELAGLPCTIPA